MVVPPSLSDIILSLAEELRQGGHRRANRMYQTIRKGFSWPNLANHIFRTRRDCHSCTVLSGTPHQHVTRMKILCASDPLEFVAVDIPGPLPRSVTGHQYVLEIKDRFSNPARAIPWRTKTASKVTDMFLNALVYHYGTPKYLWTHNDPQCMARFFEAVCGMVAAKQLPTTAYRPQINGNAELFNRTLVARSRHYVSEHQSDWSKFVQPLTYAFNIPVNWSTGTTPFHLVLTRHRQGIMLSAPKKTLLQTRKAELTPSQRKPITSIRVRNYQTKARFNLTKAQEAYKANFDKGIRIGTHTAVLEELSVDCPPNYAVTD